MITAFIKKPGVPGTVEIIDASLDSLQKIVGGYIEAVYIDDFALVVNEEGVLKGLPYNVSVGGHHLVGTVVVMRAGDEEAITPEDVPTIRAMIDEPSDRPTRGLRILSEDDIVINRAYECMTRFRISRHRDGSVTFGVESAGFDGGWTENDRQTIRLEPDDDLLAISEVFALIAKGGKLTP